LVYFSAISFLFFCLDIPKTNSGQAPELKNQGCTEMAKILIGLPKRKKLSRFFFFIASLRADSGSRSDISELGWDQTVFLS